MIKRILRSGGLSFFVLALLLPPLVTWAKPIRIGSISTEPAAEIKRFLPLAGYLATQLQSDGFDQGKVVVARSMPEMAAFLKEGKVDLYIDSPFPALAVSRLSGSKFLLRRWKKGIGEYHSVIFATKESAINRLEDLKGKMIAFEEPFSSSGYFFPKMALMQEGLKLVSKKEASDPIGPGEVGYIFSLEDENTMVWVLRGKVPAGAMDNQNYPKEARGNLNSLKIIYKTSSFPRQIVSYRADLPSKLVARIKEILIKMDQSEDGKKVLQDFERTTKFDELPDQSMAHFLRLQKFIDSELGLK
ncbi:MAG: phosphate/phosphite/phosphonate ABC transporter substrate-binding protein [Deltaproteobacteria bacterium]|nr:phosphate/phosphite/phosphonate ABC transporter substrate-binding protein [Deltaproteobacteria bacterium]